MLLKIRIVLLKLSWLLLHFLGQKYYQHILSFMGLLGVVAVIVSRARILEYRDESQRLDLYGRLYDSIVSDDRFDLDAHHIVQCPNKEGTPDSASALKFTVINSGCWWFSCCQLSSPTTSAAPPASAPAATGGSELFSSLFAAMSSSTLFLTPITSAPFPLFQSSGASPLTTIFMSSSSSTPSLFNSTPAVVSSFSTPFGTGLKLGQI